MDVCIIFEIFLSQIFQIKCIIIDCSVDEIVDVKNIMWKREFSPVKSIVLIADAIVTLKSIFLVKKAYFHFRQLSMSSISVFLECPNKWTL